MPNSDLDPPLLSEEEEPGPLLTTALPEFDLLGELEGSGAVFADRGSPAVKFGKNLWRARKHVGVSQEELAVCASLHRTEIGLLERGERTPRIDTVVKLAGALGIPIDDLIDGIDWQPGSTQVGAFTVARAR